MSFLVRAILCGISIAALAVLGLLGEALQNLARSPRLGSGCAAAAIQDFPYPTLLALETYGINTGNFALSLTPFMIVLAAVAACARGERRIQQFWAGFAATWLAALSYFGLYAWALSLPWHLMCADFERRPIEWIVPALNAVLVVGAVIVYWRGRAGREEK